MKTPILIIQGGAGKSGLKKDLRKEASRFIHGLLVQFSRRLERGMSSKACVVGVVKALEDHPLFNAGRGSKLQSDGKIRMSAALMEGQSLRFSGVVNVEKVKNPIVLSSKLLTSKDRVLGILGAEKRARTLGLPFASALTQRQKLNYQKRVGTVGAVAMDRKGIISAATSTGGRGFEWPDRISDTPTVAGNYANAFCGVSATGVGEEIVEHAVASTIVTRVEDGMSLKKAFQKTFKKARARRAQFGAVGISCRGEWYAEFTTPMMFWGVKKKETLIVEPETSEKRA